MNAVALTWSPPALGPTPTAFYLTVSDGRSYRIPADRFEMTVTGLRNGVSATFVLVAATEDGVGAAASVTASPTSGADGEIAGLIVKLDADATVADVNEVPGEAAIEAVDLAVEGSVGSDTIRVEFSEATDLATAQDIAQTLEADPAVAWAEPDRFVFTAGDGTVPNDTSYAVGQWNLWDEFGIGFGAGSTAEPDVAADGGSGVTVAVIDTGITAHPDLDARMTSGYDFVSDPSTLAAARDAGGSAVAFDGDYVDPDRFGGLGWDPNPADPGDWRNVSPERSSTWHGTRMAGVIAAQTGNGEGIVGVAAGATVQPVRALSWRGGLLSDIAASITWASGGQVDGVPANATPSRVLNLSFAVEASCPVSLQAAIDDAVSRGSVVVAAAGNANADVAGFAPANCANVISVAASGRDGKRAPYSNYGSGVDLSAPGGSLVSDGGVLSTSNAGTSSAAEASYATSEGTSIAAAQVSGAAARLLSATPALSPADVATSLTGRTLRAFAGDSCDIDPAKSCGDGILSLAQVATTPTVTAPATTPVFNVSTSGQDPGNFVIDGFAAGDTVLVTVGFVNPPSGTSFALPTRTGLTAGYGYDLTSAAMSEVAFTASQTDANAALAAMTVTTGATSGNVTLQVSASLSIADVYYNPINKHFYEYVAQTGIKATDAFAAAAAKSRYGVTGYIVAIGTAQENTFISSKISATNIWIGATDSGSEGVWKWYGGPDAGDQFWSGAAAGSATAYTDYTGTSVTYANWCSPGEPNDSDSANGGEDHAVTNWGGGTCWNDLNSVNSSAVKGFVVEYGSTANPSYSGVGSASMTAQVITEVSATVTAPSSPNGNYTQSFTVTFSHAASNIGAADFANGASSGAAVGCVFVPAATSVNANTALSVAVYGCSAGTLRLKVIGSGITFSNAALEDTMSSEVTIASTGATPAYPSISGSAASVSGAWSAALDLGSVTIDSSSCTVGNVTATVTSTAGTLAATASGSAAVTTVSATELTVTGSVTDVDATLDSVTLAKGSAGSATVRTSIVPAANSSIGTDTYLFNPDNGHYYLVTPKQSWTWRSAAEDAATRSFCGAGGYIGTLTSDAEYQFLSTRALTTDIGSLWIGGQQTNGWRWYPGPNGPVSEAALLAYDQGVPAGSGPWHANEPNNSGTDMQIYFTSNAYGWDDTKDSRVDQRSLVEFGTNTTFIAPSTSVAVTFTEAAQGTLSISTLSGTFGSSLTLTTSGGSGTGAVTYAVSNGTATGCSVSGSSLSVTSAGTCLVTATKAADANYAAVSSAQTTVTFAKATQVSLSVSSLSGTFGSELTLTTTGGSGTGAITYSVSDGTASGCAVSESSLSVTSAGTCLVTATKATDTNYLVASSSQATVTFARASQSTLSVTSLSGTYGSSLTLTTSGGSGTGAVTYAVSNGTASGCAVSGSSLSVTSAGTCVVTATKAADGNYLVVSSLATSVTFAKAGQQSLTVTSVVGTFGSALTLTTSGGSGTGAVTYSVSDGTASGCAVSGSSLSVTSAGTCVVTATKATDANYLVVSSDSTTVTLGKAAQATLSVTSVAGTYGSTLTLTASGGSGTGAVTYSVSDGTASGCSVSGSSLTVTSAGTCSVTATKATDSDYLVATSSATTVTFAKAAQSTLSITSPSGTYGSSLTLTTSGGSGTGEVTYTASNGTASGCAVSGSSLSVTSAGTCTVTATKASDANFLTVSSSQTTVTFARAGQAALLVTSTSGTYGSALTLTTSGGSGTGAVTYVAADGTASDCAVSSGALTASNAGTCQVTATKVADGNYNAQSSEATIVTIAKAGQAALSLTSVAGTYGSALTLTTSGGSGSGAISFEVAAGTASGCSLTSGALSVTSAGTCLVTAHKATDDRYDAASTAQSTVTFAKATQAAISVTSDGSVVYGTALELAANGGSGTGVLAWSVVSGSCTLAQSGSTWSVTTGDVGSACAVEVTRLGDANFLPRTSAAHAITTTTADQTVRFTSRVPEGAVVGQAYRFVATATSTLVPVLDVVLGGSTVCTIADGVVTLVGAGVCEVRARQSGNANFNAAVAVTQRFTVAWPVIPVAVPVERDRVAEHLATEPIAVPAIVTSGRTPIATVVDGTVRDVRADPLSTGNGWLVRDGDVTMSLAIERPNGSPQPLSSDAHLVITVGATVRLAGGGYLPDSRVKVFLLRPDLAARSSLVEPSTALYLGDAIVDVDGSLVGSVTIPDRLAAREYTLQVNGIARGGEVRSIAAAVNVAPEATPKALMRAGFFKAMSAGLSASGRDKLAALQAQLPEEARNVRVEITGVSVSLPTLHANLKLASLRAERIAAALTAKGVTGTYVVTIATETTVTGASGDDTAQRQQIRTVLKTADGHPLTTVTISYQATST